MSSELPKSFASGHIPALDGIRGLAVTMVVLLHFLTAAVPQNFLEKVLLMAAGKGAAFLDLFFVLSGFLITGILLDSKEQNRFFSRFFIRRTLRIFPLFYAVLICVTLFVYCEPEIAGLEGERFREAAPWAWTYLYNFFLVAKGEWYITSVDHFWSLAVEEQFYFVWPFAIYFISRRGIGVLCGWAVFVASLLYVFMHHAGYSHVALHVFTPLSVHSHVCGILKDWC